MAWALGVRTVKTSRKAGKGLGMKECKNNGENVPQGPRAVWPKACAGLTHGFPRDPYLCRK